MFKKKQKNKNKKIKRGKPVQTLIQFVLTKICLYVVKFFMNVEVSSNTAFFVQIP